MSIYCLILAIIISNIIKGEYMDQKNFLNKLGDNDQLWLKKQALKSIAAILKGRDVISEEKYNQLIPRFENFKKM